MGGGYSHASPRSHQSSHPGVLGIVRRKPSQASPPVEEVDGDTRVLINAGTETTSSLSLNHDTESLIDPICMYRLTALNHL
jgi:hypothetical protein